MLVEHQDILEDVELLTILTRWNREEIVKLLKRRCPECGKDTIIKAGSALVCRTCGIEIENIPLMSQDLPFDQTYAIESKIVFNNSLGDTLPRNELFTIIAQSSAGTEDLGIRARHLKTVIQSSELPQTRRLKEEVSKVLRKYGLYNPAKFDSDKIVFSNHCAVLAMRIARFLAASWTRPYTSYKSLATSIVVTKLKEVEGLRSLSDHIRETEQPNDNDVSAVMCFQQCPFLKSGLKLRRYESASFDDYTE